MSTRVFLFALMVGNVVSSTALAFECAPNYCDTVRCVGYQKLVAECSHGVVRAGATLCRCCAACITQLKLGEQCLYLTGLPATTQCSEGLICRDFVCVKWMPKTVQS